MASVVALQLSFVALAAGHGAMVHPRPRNNDLNATAVTLGTMLRFKMTDAGLAQEYFPDGVQTCGGPVTTFSGVDGACFMDGPWGTNYPSIISTTVPSVIGGRIVDCTRDNRCQLSDNSIFDATEPSAVWMVSYMAPNCSSVPTWTYKLNLNKCTTLDGVAMSPDMPGCEGLSCLWFSQGCGIGCPVCTEDNTDFFGSPCNTTMEPTLNDPKYRTYNRYGTDDHGDWSATRPWRAPGNSPVLDACGMAGGSTRDNTAAAGYPPSGHVYGDRGSQLALNTNKTVWEAGTSVAVSWWISNNHGGGYQYRLCPAFDDLTEECFQRMPVAFAGKSQTLVLHNGTRLAIPATLVSEGTSPSGSVWAMNPIPACSGWEGTDCSKPQFPPPPGCDETCWGSVGPGNGPNSRNLPVIEDLLFLSGDLVPGEYVLGLRWDCEQTGQIWQSCADIVIKGAVIV